MIARAGRLAGAVAAATCALALAATGQPAAAGGGGPRADAAIEQAIMRERALAVAVRRQGGSAARQFADRQAERLVPHRRPATDGAWPRRWTMRGAFAACDGSVVVTHGMVPGDRRRGYIIVWLRGADGQFRFVLRHDGIGPAALPASGNQTAACDGQPGIALTVPVEGADYKLGAATDQTLLWSSAVLPGGGGAEAEVRLWDGAVHRPVLLLRDAAPKPR